MINTQRSYHDNIFRVSYPLENEAMYRFSALIRNLAAFLYGLWNIDDTTEAVNGWHWSALMMVTHSHHTTLFSVSKHGHMTALYVYDLVK